MTHQRSSAIAIWVVLLLGAVLIFPISSYAEAHVPGMAEDNTAPSDAVEVEDPLKSWAFYDEIHDAGEMRFYRLELNSGDRLKVSVFVPDEDGIVPTLAVWGPDVLNDSATKEEIINGSSYLVVGSDEEDGSFEPFTPSVLYERLKLDIEVNETGTYYLVIHGNGGTGHFGVALGYKEEFSASEWVLVPVNVLFIRQWEGQNLLLVLLPLLVVVVAGIYRMIRGQDKDIMKMLRDGRSRPFHQWILSLGGLLMMGTGVMMLIQVLLAFIAIGPDNGMAIPIVMGAFQIGLGASIHAQSISIINTITVSERLRIVLMGLFGLVIWAGLIIGPALVVIGAMMKINKEEPESDRDSMRERSDAR